MSVEHVITVIVRTAVAILVLDVAAALWRASRADGPLVKAFFWAFVGLAIPMFWYITASLLYQTDTLRWLMPYFWERAWLAWSPALVTLILLRRAMMGGPR